MPIPQQKVAEVVGEIRLKRLQQRYRELSGEPAPESLTIKDLDRLILEKMVVQHERPVTPCLELHPEEFDEAALLATPPLTVTAPTSAPNPKKRTKVTPPILPGPAPTDKSPKPPKVRVARKKETSSRSTVMKKDGKKKKETRPPIMLRISKAAISKPSTTAPRLPRVAEWRIPKKCDSTKSAPAAATSPLNSLVVTIGPDTTRTVAREREENPPAPATATSPLMVTIGPDTTRTVAREREEKPPSPPTLHLPEQEENLEDLFGELELDGAHNSELNPLAAEFIPAPIPAITKTPLPTPTPRFFGLEAQKFTPALNIPAYYTAGYTGPRQQQPPTPSTAPRTAPGKAPGRNQRCPRCRGRNHNFTNCSRPSRAFLQQTEKLLGFSVAQKQQKKGSTLPSVTEMLELIQRMAPPPPSQ